MAKDKERGQQAAASPITNMHGAKILVTGGSGTIGAELVRQFVDEGAAVVRVFSNDENGLFEIKERLGAIPSLRFLLGDVRDRDRLRLAAKDIDYIFHAAALKHVPLCGYDPMEAVKTNVLGSQNVIEAALDRNVKAVVGISTDKAADPVSTMGVTKLLMERLFHDANTYSGVAGTRFSCVRFGNVLASRGSVIPTFLRQIASGGPVTVTDARMVRYFMTTHDAVALIRRAAAIARGGEIFILRMPRLRILDLAKVLIARYASHYGHDPRKVRIAFTGVRISEKLDETLVADYERPDLYQSPQMYLLPGAQAVPSGFARLRRGALPAGPLLTHRQIGALLDQIQADLALPQRSA